MPVPVTWAAERLRFRLSGGVTGPGHPLKSVPIYISRRPPAPAGGGAGEIRLPFPSKGDRVPTCSPEMRHHQARRFPRSAPRGDHRSTNAPRNPGQVGLHPTAPLREEGKR